MQVVHPGDATADVRRKLWTRDEAARLTEMFPGERYELIEGELIDKMGQKPPHAYVIGVLTELFGAAFAGRVRIQSSIELPDPDGQYSEPEPDVAVLHKKGAEFFTRHPGPEDIALLIEVSDTTFRFDRSTKYRLYARAGIQEYWIVDITEKRIIVCRSPRGEDYYSVEIFAGQQTVSPVAAPEFSIAVEQTFA